MLHGCYPDRSFSVPSSRTFDENHMLPAPKGLTPAPSMLILILKPVSTGTGFDAQFEDIRVVRVGTGEVEVELEVTDKLLVRF